MACFIGFANSKVVSVGVGVSVLSQRVLILPTATECLLSIPDTSETITSIEAALPNMALGCVTSTSVTNTQNVLPISAEPSVSILSVLLPLDTSPEETTYSSFLRSVQCSGVPRNFVWGGSTNSVEDRGQRERESEDGSALVRGSGGSCNLYKKFHFI